MRGGMMVKFLSICGAVLLIMLIVSHPGLITDMSSFTRDLLNAIKS